MEVSMSSLSLFTRHPALLASSSKSVIKYLQRLFVLLPLLTTFFVLTSSPVQAATYFITYSISGAGSCTNTSFFFTGNVTFSVPPLPVTVQIVETTGGVQDFNQTIAT